MDISNSEFSILSKNCPFRNKGKSRTYGPGDEYHEYHTCRALDPEPMGNMWDKCCMENCAVSYWVNAIENIKDDE